MKPNSLITLGSRALACCVALLVAASGANAQVPANEQWRTIHTRHFNVHFTRPLESEARHAASVAERAYANLAQELVPPRGTIDVVVSDGTDVSNGSATVLPRAHVVIHARPPVDQRSLESYDDWTVLVLQHELTHIFQLDRAGGIWKLGQHVFGRNPALFPNYYKPAWITEGLAVYYESRFTSGGRLQGTYSSAVARAAALDHRVPPLNQLSLATSRFPFGESVYVYGSFVWDELARTHGAARVPAFVEKSSAATIPILLDREARATFGESFTDAWRRWRDSVLSGPSGPSGPAGRGAPGLDPVLDTDDAWIAPGGGRTISFPRWIDQSTLLFLANTGRETVGMYTTPLGGVPVRSSRRNSLDVNAVSGSGTIVFGQSDYTDRFHTRGDLYSAHGGSERRLTYGARLSTPDVRGDGEIVAVQTVPGATRLVLVSADGRHIRPITSVSRDTQWTAPRWSPQGTLVAAVRIVDGQSGIAILDPSGRDVRVVAQARAVLRSPAWSPDGSLLFYTSDQSGSSQLYAVAARQARDTPPLARRLTDDRGGVYDVDVTGADADSIRVASTVLRSDGYHLAAWTTSRAAIASAATIPSLEPSRAGADPRWAVPDDSSRASGYSPLRTLIPAYWSPTVERETGDRGTLVGVLTSGSDVIGRHEYAAQASVNTRNRNATAVLAYEYNRFRNPVIDVRAEQSWDYASLITALGTRAGDLERRNRLLSLHATFVRPRARTYSALTVGAELEERWYDTDPSELRDRLDPFYTVTHRYPTAVLAALFSNTQRPALSISPEDGVSMNGVVRQRWETGSGASGRTAIGVLNGYKSLDLPGFAHHVIALRLAGGAADRRSPSEFGVGGVNGSSLEIVPGFSIGSSAHTFAVRGFPSGSETGIYATAASAEYRAPLAMPSRGLGLFPLFVDRASIALFADAGRAACPVRAEPACGASAYDGPTLASVGAELDIDSALQFDVPYRFRLGIAHPVRGAAFTGAPALSAFVTLGGTF